MSFYCTINNPVKGRCIVGDGGFILPALNISQECGTLPNYLFEIFG